MVIKGMMICNESRIRFKNIQVHEEPRAQLQINFFTTSVETSVVAFRKQLKETALRVSQKKKRIESPLPLLFLIFQSVNATSSQEINVLNTKFSSYPSQYRSQSNKTVPHRAT